MPRKGEPLYKEINEQGLPVFVDQRKPPLPPPKIEIKPRVPHKLEPTPKQLEAKENYIRMGGTPDVKRAAGEAAGYHPNAAVRGVNSTLKPIVGILKEEKGIDDHYIADRIEDGLNAMHPMAPKQKDHNARYKFVQECNRLFDNYPPKRIESNEKKIVLMITGEDVRQSREADRIREENDRDPL